MYLKYRKFYLEKGHHNISHKYGKKLYNWVIRQRSLFNKNLLPKERIKRLNDINFPWDTKENNWDLMFNELSDYYLKNGHCNIKDSNKNLAIWITIQKNKYNESTLSQEKIKKLNSINFIWNIYDNIWEEMYLILKDYVKEYGNCLVKANYIYKNKKLGSWVNNQRAFYKNNKLSEEKIDKLNKIGFDWGNSRKNKWEKMFNYLIKYKKEFNNLDVPYRYLTQDNKKLGTWVGIQRINYKEGKLIDERIKLLEKIGFKWNVK